MLGIAYCFSNSSKILRFSCLLECLLTGTDDCTDCENCASSTGDISKNWGRDLLRFWLFEIAPLRVPSGSSYCGTNLDCANSLLPIACCAAVFISKMVGMGKLWTTGRLLVPCESSSCSLMVAGLDLRCASSLEGYCAATISCKSPPRRYCRELISLGVISWRWLLSDRLGTEFSSSSWTK